MQYKEESNIMQVCSYAEYLQHCLGLLYTHHDDRESSDGVIWELKLLLYGHPDLAIGGGHLSRPVAVAPDLSILLKFGQHDNCWGILLPHHAPEVHNSARDGALCGNEGIWLSVSLHVGGWGGRVHVLGRCS